MAANFEQARAFVFDQLQKLPDHFTYHGIHHTRDDVLPAAQRLAAASGVEGEELLLLCTGALFHDVGLLEGVLGHEETGARMAVNVLPGFGYAPRQIETVSAIIRATRLPQSPETLLQAMMCDADLDSIGREDFFVTSHTFRLELMATGPYIPVREWYERQLHFLEDHSYFTEAARTLRGATKAANVRELRDVLRLTEHAL